MAHDKKVHLSCFESEICVLQTALNRTQRNKSLLASHVGSDLLSSPQVRPREKRPLTASRCFCGGIT
ncbi:unnamed protein product [Arctogadus glacialis]